MIKVAGSSSASAGEEPSDEDLLAPAAQVDVPGDYYLFSFN